MSPRRPNAGIAQAALGRALLDFASVGRRPRCGEEPHLWTSEYAEERAVAARACLGCPLAGPCLSAAIEAGDVWGVRAGFDLGEPSVRRRAAAALRPTGEGS